MPAAAFFSAALPPPSRTLSRRLVVSRAAAAAASASASSSSGWQGACADSFPPHVTRTRPCHAVSPAAAACVLGDETRRVGAGGGIVSLDDAGAPCSPLSARLDRLFVIGGFRRWRGSGVPGQGGVPGARDHGRAHGIQPHQGRVITPFPSLCFPSCSHGRPL
jgi:hypothetical protein